ncbi:Acetoacetyl-CoA synthetase [Vanrija pseudolonga]|uniref:Acetoacetyl-CoA synthetase n=1 Tax=Vanrija pseudolonga TaxID=143232 RepID=A0AAF1BK44_9TREE|nr:Acetoacetyl-CoA synthetase [Vanrija pseudolonga]
MNGKKPEIYWQPGGHRPHDDEPAFVDAFRNAVNKRFGLNLADWWALHEWSTTQTEQFLDMAWDYFGLIGDRGAGPSFVRGIPMDEPQQYFPNARINVAENLLLGHKSALSKTKFAMIATVEPDPNSDASEPVETRRITYYELYDQVRRAAHALKLLGVGPGDSVASYAATSCEMLIIFYATLSIGALFSSTPAEFGVIAVVDRYDIIKPKVLFTIDSYRYGRKEHELSTRAREVVKRVSAQGKLTNVVVFGQLAADREPAPDSLKGYVDAVKVSSFSDFIATGARAPPKIDFWRGPFNHPIWIVFSSGTTGKPKSIYGPGGGILLMRKVVINLHLNLDHRDAYLQFATMGWIVWNMHVLFAAVGGTVVAYDGSPFHPQSVLWRLIEKYRVTQLGASPRYIQTLAKNKFKPREGRDLSCLKQLYTTGAPVTNDVYEFCERELDSIFVNNAAGGTEIGGSALQSTHVLPAYKGELQTPVLGVSLIAADKDGRPQIGEEGTLVFSKPFANMPYYFADDPGRKRYKETYFADYRNPPMFNMNDSVWINPETRGWMMFGRADGVLNPSGVRFGSAELYYILESAFPEVDDSIAVGQQTADNNERVVLFLKTRGDAPVTADLVGRIKAAVAAALSRRHVPEVIAQCPGVPYTGSGKKVEASVKKLINGVALTSINVTGVVNPEVYKWYAAWGAANAPKVARL